jgi:hypothetical protein
MDFITELRPNEVFVFGSNLEGSHAGGAAKTAYDKFGAEEGVYFGLTGQSFAIPTCIRPGVPFKSMYDIEPYVEEFLNFAEDHPNLTFLVSPLGTGVARFPLDYIDSLFEDIPFNVICLWREA